MLDLQEQRVWFEFKGKGIYFTNRHSVSRTIVLFLFLVIIGVKIFGESRKANDKIFVSSFKQAGATAVSKSSPRPCLAEVLCEALLCSVFR